MVKLKIKLTEHVNLIFVKLNILLYQLKLCVIDEKY